MNEYILKLKSKPTPHATAQYWRKCQVEELFDLPFLDLIFQAASVHRQHFDPQKVQISALLSIKTGGC
ncbi:MAG: biotin synthase BioB, partial [Neisseriaceae bacterium]|nr:biotin synthase BioB [Neisseriaceae bacterium]